MRPDLIVHIGAGKTGTSAIQQALGDLNQNKEFPVFLGLMFENLPDERCAGWGASIDKWPIYWENMELAGQLLFDILKSALDKAKENGAGPLIWSNESLLEGAEAALSAISSLRSSGYKIRVQCYVRRQDAWAYSSYIQWGLKHKTYSGSILPFGRWIRKGFWRGSDFTFYSRLQRWRSVVSDDLEVFNYDAHPDAVNHFFEWNGLGKPELARVNNTPNTAILTGYALMNQLFPETVLPDAFEGRLDKAKDCPPEWIKPLDIESFLPTPDELEYVRTSTEEDRTLLASLLAQTGDPPLNVEPPLSFVEMECNGEIQEMLARLWLSAEREVLEMTQSLSATQHSLAETRAALSSADKELARFRSKPIRTSIRLTLRRIGFLHSKEL